VALVTVVEDGRLAKSRPGYQAPDKAAVFAATTEMLDGPTVHQPKIPGIRRDIYVTQPADNAVEQPGGKTLDNAFARPGSPLGKNNLVALLPFLNELGDEFGRVLKVGINNNDSVAGGVIDAGGGGDLMAKISAEEDVFDVSVPLDKLGDDAAGLVGTAVVDEDKLVAFGSGSLQAIETLKKGRQTLLLVIDGNDYGNQGHWFFLRFALGPLGRDMLNVSAVRISR